MQARIFISAVVAGLAFAAPAPAAAVENPPRGISPSEFATQYSGCLGQLRSQIAQGNFNGVGPFGEHFTGSVNPGAHQGTVGEYEFLRDVLGLSDAQIAELCGA
jgi:hypothetical protein